MEQLSREGFCAYRGRLGWALDDSLGTPRKITSPCIFSLNSWRKIPLIVGRKEFKIMPESIQEKNTGKKPNYWRTRAKLPVVGLLVLGLCLIITAVSGATIPDSNTVNASGVTVPVFNPSLNATAALTPLETLSAKVEAGNATPAITVVPITTQMATTVKVIPVTSPTVVTGSKDSAVLTTGKAVNDQFTMNSGKKVTQAQREAAAAGYKKIRDAFLMQGSLATPAGGNGMVGALPALVGAAPALNPGAVPHYFGPYPNWANSPMPKGKIASISVDSGGSAIPLRLLPLRMCTSLVTVQPPPRR